jgi:hypothetical protein
LSSMGIMGVLVVVMAHIPSQFVVKNVNTVGKRMENKTKYTTLRLKTIILSSMALLPF